MIYSDLEAANAEIALLRGEVEAWEDVPDGKYMNGELRLDRIRGHHLIALRGTHENGQRYWHGSSLPEGWRIQRRRTGQEG